MVKGKAIEVKWIARSEIVSLGRGSKGWLIELAQAMRPGGLVLRMSFTTLSAAKAAQSWLWGWGRKNGKVVAANLGRAPDEQVFYVYAEVRDGGR